MVGEKEEFKNQIHQNRYKNKERDKWVINGEPTDGCFLTLCKKANLDTSYFIEIDKIPFDSDFKYIAKIVDLDNNRYLIVKGAPDKLIDIIKNSNSEFDQTYWQNEVSKLAKSGKRVVAVAYKSLSKDVVKIEHGLLKHDPNNTYDKTQQKMANLYTTTKRNVSDHEVPESIRNKFK